MEYPKYLVNISYYPARTNGQQIVFLNGVTQSMPVYEPGYYYASMPELKIAASGSNYTNALNNLLVIATSSAAINGGNGALNSTRTW